jgi:hypothetical protein
MHDESGAPAGRGEPAGEQVWTVGEAAAFLNAGPVDFRVRPKTVSRWCDDGSRGLRVAMGQRGEWRRVLASSVRELRASMLASAGYADPEWPVATSRIEDGKETT